MKAIVCRSYGSPDVLKLEEVEKPAPGDAEILVRVHASAVTAADGMMRRGEPFPARLVVGLRRPKVPTPGTGFAGDVEAVGKDVTRFREGDQVFGDTGLGFCTNAEYARMPEEGVLTTKPANISYEEAAPICYAGVTALNLLRDTAGIEGGQKVLVNGASGSVGTAAVQVARHFGAGVTGVCSTTNVDMVRSLGADQVVDYTKEDFTRSGRTYDIIFDAVGKSSFSRCKGSLTREGTYVSAVSGLRLTLQGLWTSKVGGKKATFSATGFRPVSRRRELLEELKEIIEAGEIRSVIDRRYPLGQTAEAHRYVDRGHAKGNVVIAMDYDGG